MSFTLPAIHDGIAALIPEREAIVSPKKRLLWRDFAGRSRRLSNLLAGAGLGCHRNRSELEGWESGQDHFGIYLYNGPEYLEAMAGAFRARVAPFNVNYRYVEDELLYLFKDAATRAIIYHAAFAPRLARILPNLPPLALLLQVEDGSGELLLPGALDYEQALASASDTNPHTEPHPDDLYIVYTGGTTGMPKGVLWRQEDIFFAALGGHIPGGVPLQSLDELLSRVPYGDTMRILPAPPFMHGAGHWTALMMLHQGGTVILPANVQKLDPDDIWQTIQREKVFSLSIVGDAFARPLIDQLRNKQYDLSCLKIIGSGGAILSKTLKQAFIELIPDVLVVDGYGSSETGAQGSSAMAAGSDAPTAFRLDEHTCLLDETMTQRLQPGDDAVGWVARSGHVPLGYLGDPDKTRRTYRVIDGIRYSVPGDRARLAADGSVILLGRDSVCINTGGEKVFAEEVEQALKKHPAVYDVLVTGTPSERWGSQVTAVVALRPGQPATEQELLERAASELARYKLPRAFVFVDTVLRTPTGKPDYRWAKETATRALTKSA
ncbi:MAG: acyl-CoA synthetase [Deltaproteobacteria bacterium]|nr:acyl-CoA synthetase [Deltaproteobacteria bacterium]